MMMTHGQAPDQSNVNPDWKDTVLHARVSIGGTELMRSAYLSLSVESDVGKWSARDPIRERFTLDQLRTSKRCETRRDAARVGSSA
jgi:hypothetical protein